MEYFDFCVDEVRFVVAPSDDLVVVLSEYNLNRLFDDVSKAIDKIALGRVINQFFELCECEVFNNLHFRPHVETYKVQFFDGGYIKFYIYCTKSNQ